MALDHISQGHSNKVKWKDESVKSYRAEFELRPLTEVWWILGKMSTLLPGGALGVLDFLHTEEE